MSVRPVSRALIVLSVAGMVLPATHASAGRARGQERIEGRFIVGFQDSVKQPGALRKTLEASEGFRTDRRYRHALEGFAARLSTGQVERLRRHPLVDFVVPDREVHALGTVSLAQGETAPTGVRRVEAATSSEAHEASSVNVAVLDTGIDLSHGDLNAVAGRNCKGSGSPTDGHGHGTHVAGTIAAENTGSRVVGVAPGTRVVAVKVLDDSGSGTWSDVICGIDWVTGTRTDGDPGNDIAVANLSLGGGGIPVKTCGTTTDALHRAICRSTAAGVTYVVAAGNEGWDFDYAPKPDVPAAYPEVLTVTAVSDSDGRPGAAGGAPSCRSGEADDRYASFSSYASTSAGRAHTVAGPGVCVLSDWPGGGTRTISGTSMAAPHLAGAVALCLAEAGVSGPCAGMTPAQIIQKIRADAKSHTDASPGYGFTGDPLRPVSGRYYGYLARVGMVEPAPEPEPEPEPEPVTVVVASPGGATIARGTRRSGNARSLLANDNLFLEIASTRRGTRTTSWYGSFSDVSGDPSRLTVIYRGGNSRRCTQTVAIWNWGRRRWTTLNSRVVGRSEVKIKRTAPGDPAGYVSGTSGDGDVRVRVRCTSSRNFTARADLMRIVFVVS